MKFDDIIYKWPYHPPPGSPFLLGISGNGLVDRFKLSSFSLSDALNTDEFCCSFIANALESFVKQRHLFWVYFETRDINCQN